MLDEELFKAYAMKMVGLPYIWGGDDTIIGFDCSGLCIELLTAFGGWQGGDTTAHGLYKHFIANAASHERRCGALVFYGHAERISHVGMLLSRALMLEAGGGGSKTVTKAAAAAQNAYIRIRPYTRRQDLVDIILPHYGS